MTHQLCCCDMCKHLLQSGGWFNKKMPSYQYRKFHCGDKTILRPSYLHNGISYTGKMTSLYWIRALKASKWNTARWNLNCDKKIVNEMGPSFGWFTRQTSPLGLMNTSWSCPDCFMEISYDMINAMHKNYEHAHNHHLAWFIWVQMS